MQRNQPQMLPKINVQQPKERPAFDEAELLLAKLVKQSQAQIDLLLGMKNEKPIKQIKTQDEQKNIKERTFGGDFKDFFSGALEQIGSYLGYFTGINALTKTKKPVTKTKQRVEPTLDKEIFSKPKISTKPDNIQQVISTLAGDNSIVKTTLESLNVQKPNQNKLEDNSTRFFRRIATEVVLMRKFLENSMKAKAVKKDGSINLERKTTADNKSRLILPGDPTFTSSKTIENQAVKNDDEYIDKLSTAIARKLEDVIGGLGRTLPNIGIDLPSRTRTVPVPGGGNAPGKDGKKPMPTPDAPEAERKAPAPQDGKDNKPKPQPPKGKVPSKLGSIFQIGLGLLGLAGTAATYSGELNSNEEEELAKLKQKAAEQKKLENVQEKVQVPSQSTTGSMLDEVSKEKTDLTNMSDMLEGMLKPIVSNTVVDNSKSQFLAVAADSRNSYGSWMNHLEKNQVGSRY